MLAMIVQTWQFIVVALAGWLNRQQQDVVALSFPKTSSGPPKVQTALQNGGTSTDLSSDLVLSQKSAEV